MSAAHRVDVAVIGGGPAGLSAAVRCRWVKGHGAIPLKTAVFESGTPGGLVAWRGGYLTGPSFFVKPDELAERLIADCERYEVPIVADRVVAVGPAVGGTAGERRARWHLATADGADWTADAVILATGLRAQLGEARWFANGVYLTYMGYEHLYRLFKRIPQTRGTTLPLAVVGNRNTALLDGVLAAVVKATGARVRYLLETAGPPGATPTAGDVTWGRYAGVEGEAGSVVLHGVNHDGRPLAWDVAAVIVDYNAFELHPSLDLGLPAATPRNDRGFVDVDREQRTTVPFLYAAGDITGGMAMVLEALSQGARAGFAAYEDLYRERFSNDPVLFAYRPQPRPLAPDFRGLPDWRDDDHVEVLASAARFADYRIVAGQPGHALLERGAFSFADLCAALADRDSATNTLDDWLERKLVTVRR